MNEHFDPHPASMLFPMMPPEQFEALKQDIRENGLNQPGTLYQGKILDGRNRLKACNELSVEMEWCEIEDDDPSFDPVLHVVSLNLHRRHLTETQRAMVAAKVEGMYAAEAKQRSGGRPSLTKPKVNLPELNGQARDKAAKTLNVSGKSVSDAKAVLKRGSPELISAVERGDVAVSKAAKVARNTPKSEQLKAAKAKPAKPTQEPRKQARTSRVVLPNDPSPAEVAEVESWLEHQDERPGVERFKTLWQSCNEAAQAAIRLMFADDVL